MATYKDVDKLIEMYERSADDDWNKRTAPSSWAEAFECVIADIDDQPTADVVPREEVEKIFEEIDKLSYRFMNDEHYIFGDMVWDIAELKKKYIGDKR